MTAKVILNPYANRWRAQARKDELIAVLNHAGIQFELETTTAPGHGLKLAAQAIQDGFSPIIAAGGDGSISEVVNGMLDSDYRGEIPPLGVMPLGSANDFVVNLNLPTELISAAEIIAAGNTKAIDIGMIKFGPDLGSQRFFDNNSAIGLEPTITLIQQRITKLKGVLRYLVATLMGVMQNPQWTVHLEWDNGNYTGPATLVTIGNNPLTGGLFYMTPDADPFDGKLTFVYGSMSTRLQILRLLPRTMKPQAGSYIEHPNIHQVHSSWLKIHTEQPTPLHADGEIQSTAVHDIEYHTAVNILPVLLPQ